MKFSFIYDMIQLHSSNTSPLRKLISCVSHKILGKADDIRALAADFPQCFDKKCRDDELSDEDMSRLINILQARHKRLKDSKPWFPWLKQVTYMRFPYEPTNITFYAIAQNLCTNDNIFLRGLYDEHDFYHFLAPYQLLTDQFARTAEYNEPPPTAVFDFEYFYCVKTDDSLVKEPVPEEDLINAGLLIDAELIDNAQWQGHDLVRRRKIDENGAPVQRMISRKFCMQEEKELSSEVLSAGGGFISDDDDIVLLAELRVNRDGGAYIPVPLWN